MICYKSENVILLPYNTLRYLLHDTQLHIMMQLNSSLSLSLALTNSYLFTHWQIVLNKNELHSKYTRCCICNCHEALVENAILHRGENDISLSISKHSNGIID